MSRCAGKTAFRDEGAAARARDRYKLDPERNTTYQCDTCGLWHYGRSGGPRRHGSARRARARLQSTRTTLGQALRAAGYQHSSEGGN